MASVPKTKPTDVDPTAFCAQLPTARRRQEGARLLEVYGEITGEPAVMWGPSMIGYGIWDNTDDSARTTKWFQLGFSPRAAALSLYGLQEADGASALLDRLGKHRRGRSCIYVNGLKDIDEQVLRELITLAWVSGTHGC